MAGRRLWWARVRLTHECVFGMAMTLDDVLLLHAPLGAGPSVIERVHVESSEEERMLVFRVYGRECA